MGYDWSNWMPARTGQAAGDTIKGVGASPGRVAGTAAVIHGPGEFAQMHQGDILVAKITTPAWTPLFALAAGVVTDVGGPLSHSSIVRASIRSPRYWVRAWLLSGSAAGSASPWMVMGVW